MFLSHDQLEILTCFLTISGGGWVVAIQLQKNRLDEKISENTDAIKTQWIRIDEIKDKYFKVADHEAFKKEIYETMDKMFRPIGSDINRLDASINRLADRFDKFFSSREKI